MRAPFGAHPFYSRGYYIQDNEHLREYNDAANTAAAATRKPCIIISIAIAARPRRIGDYLERIGIKRLLALNEY